MRIASLFSFLLLSTAAFAVTPPITKSNWTNHPEIKAIRAIYNEVEAADKKGELRSRSCKASMEAKLFEDSAGVVRKYARSGGTEDQWQDALFYYDTAKRLRFIYLSMNAVNGTRMEIRAYYAAKDGELLYYDVKKVRGKGWPLQKLAELSDPRDDFERICAKKNVQ